MIRFRFVSENRTDLPVKRMGELVGVPRSSFCAWVDHKPSARDRADAELLVTIRDIYGLRAAAPGRSSGGPVPGGPVDAGKRSGRGACG